MGIICIAKGIPNKRYTAEYKTLAVETKHKEKLSYTETAQLFEINTHI